MGWVWLIPWLTGNWPSRPRYPGDVEQAPRQVRRNWLPGERRNAIAPAVLAGLAAIAVVWGGPGSSASSRGVQPAATSVASMRQPLFWPAALPGRCWPRQPLGLRIAARPTPDGRGGADRQRPDARDPAIGPRVGRRPRLRPRGGAGHGDAGLRDSPSPTMTDTHVVRRLRRGRGRQCRQQPIPGWFYGITRPCCA